MAKIGKYSLVLNDNIIVKVPWELFDKDINQEVLEENKLFENKDKVPLSIIDAFTTNFYTEKGLLEYLSKKYDLKVTKLEIKYKENHQERTVPIALKGQTELYNLSRKNFGEYSISQKEQNQMIGKLFSIKRTKSYIFDFLHKNKYIPDKLCEYINNCYHFEGTEEGYNFNLGKLQIRFNYRSYRDVYDGLKELYLKTYEVLPQETAADYEFDRKLINRHLASVAELEEYYGISLSSNENGYTIDPEEQMAQLDGKYDIEEDVSLMRPTQDIYSEIEAEDNGQILIPLDKAGYTKTLKKER